MLLFEDEISVSRERLSVAEQQAWEHEEPLHIRHNDLHIINAYFCGTRLSRECTLQLNNRNQTQVISPLRPDLIAAGRRKSGEFEHAQRTRRFR